MLFSTTFLAAAFPLVFAAPAIKSVAEKRACSTVSYYNPADNGGSMLDVATSTAGEPINVIISGLSSAEVLTSDGFQNWAYSISYSTSCLGITSEDGSQTANLGDGRGEVGQTFEMRYDYTNDDFGSCLETLTGGNHFRAWQQIGSEADSQAWFLACSVEEDISESHTIAADGYDNGRDEIVSVATAGTSYNGVTYTATVESISGLLASGSAGINHDISIDGIVKVLTITTDPAGTC